MKNWVEIRKNDGCIVATFMKLNVKSEDGNIKIISSCVFLSNFWLKPGVSKNKLSYKGIRYLFYVTYKVNDKYRFNSHFQGKDKNGYILVAVMIDIQYLISFLYQGLHNEVSPNSLDCTEFWREVGERFGDSVDKIISSAVFIFNKLSWWNIVLAFKLGNIDLNGGKISSRHIMKPTDFILSTFVRDVVEVVDGKLDINSVRNFYSDSYKNDNLSSQINLAICEKYKSNEIAIKNKLFEGKRFTDIEVDEDGTEQIIKSNLSFNYEVYCDLTSLYILKKLDYLKGLSVTNCNILRSKCENSADSIRRVDLSIEGMIDEDRIRNKQNKKYSNRRIDKVMVSRDWMIENLSILKGELLKMEKLVDYIENWVKNEKDKNNNFQSDDLPYLEKYKDNLNGLIENFLRNENNINLCFEIFKGNVIKDESVKDENEDKASKGSAMNMKGGFKDKEWGKRGYHTSVRDGQHLQIFNSKLNIPICKRKICPVFDEGIDNGGYKDCLDDINCMRYENSNLNSISNSNSNFKELRENFLKDVSLFNKKLMDLIDNEYFNSECDKLELQKKIEEYCVNYEYDCLLNIFLNKYNEDKNNRYDTFYLNCMKDWYSKVEKVLINYMHEYEINDFEKLIKIIKHGRKGKVYEVEVILLLIVMKYSVLERNIKKEKSFRYFVNSKEYNEKYVKSLVKKFEAKSLENELYDIISLLIRLIVSLISDNLKNGVTDLFETTQAYLTTTLGDQLLKRLGKKLPESFLINFNDEDKKMIENFYIDNLINPSEETIGNVGANLLSLLMDSVDILESEKKTVNNKTNIYIRISSKYIEMFTNRLLYPNKLPMLISPLKWNRNNSGGYISSQYKRLINGNLVHESKRNRYKNELSDVQYNTVNYLNNQKFKIDKDMLDFLLVEYNNDCSIVFDGGNRFDNRRIDKSNEKKIKANNSKYLLYRYVLSLSIVYENKVFYIPTFYDFRGRIYSLVDYLTYQGEDMARSLITFYNGCEINENNIVYVLQHLANTAGKSKLKINSKNKWAIDFINQLNLLPFQLDFKDLSSFFENRNNNIELFNDLKVVSIFDLARNENVINVMSHSDEKLQFLNILFNLIKCLIKPNEKFCTPICFDATTSGFQHLAALFQDLDLAKASNVLNNIEESNIVEKGESVGELELEQELEKVERGDVYQKVAQTVNEYIEKELKDENLKNTLLKIDINRKLLKKPCMTVPYNVGLKTMHLDLIKAGFFIKKVDAVDVDKKDKSTFFIVSKDILKKGVTETVILRYDELFMFSKFLYDAVYETFPSLAGYVKYLNKFASLISSLNKPIIWTTPVGMKIYMGYTLFVQKNATVFIKKEKKRGSTVSLPLNKINKLANKIAFLPNFIHSMDSANVQLLIKNLISENRFINLFTIHDCFASTPETMRLLNYEVRRAFTMIYFDQNYIYTMHRNFLAQIISHTTIYMDNGKEIIPLDLTQIDKIDYTKTANLFILLNNKRVYIPELPFNVDWTLIKDVFEEGIKKSIYFIN
uniref:DNA-directed RNA polymerase n=1 Tax=Termitomyces sp. DKA64 TaxID=2811476 RepID=A0A8F1D509_9AGAR|nr:RNA polymerase [Termitomyces sp. DKA64]